MIDYEKIDDSQVEELIESLSDFVIERGLEAPAVLFLEMNKPLGFVASQFTIMASPFAALLFGIDKIGQFSKLLSKRESIEELITRIENKAASKNKPVEQE
jgi:hypothetical protein